MRSQKIDLITPSIENSLSAVVLSNAQESAALLRGTVSGVIASGASLSLTEWDQIAQMHAALLINLESPFLVLSDQNKKRLAELRQGQAFDNTLAAVQKVLEHGVASDSGPQADHFFLEASVIVDEIGKVNAAVVEDLIKRADEVESDAGRAMVAAVVVGVFILCTMGVLLFWMLCSTVRPIISASAMLKEIAEGEGDLNKRLDVMSGDEIGELAGWFNVLPNGRSPISRESRKLSTRPTGSIIAAAVEEQSVSTMEIATNVAQAAQGFQEVTENVGISSTVAGEIARDIAEVNQAAGEMANGGSQVKMSAAELNRRAGQLKEMVERFRV